MCMFEFARRVYVYDWTILCAIAGNVMSNYLNAKFKLAGRARLNLEF